jgi:predicted metal-binding membrane protein
LRGGRSQLLPPCITTSTSASFLAVALGITDLRLVAPLTALMTFEKIDRHGDRAPRHAGAALLVAVDLVVVAHSFS